jgi:hypothetical protein
MVGVVSASMASVSMVYDVIASIDYLSKACYVFASMAHVSRAGMVSLPTDVESA